MKLQIIFREYCNGQSGGTYSEAVSSRGGLYGHCCSWLHVCEQHGFEFSRALLSGAEIFTDGSPIHMS